MKYLYNLVLTSSRKEFVLTGSITIGTTVLMKNILKAIPKICMKQAKLEDVKLQRC